MHFAGLRAPQYSHTYWGQAHSCGTLFFLYNAGRKGSGALDRERTSDVALRRPRRLREVVHHFRPSVTGSRGIMFHKPKVPDRQIVQKVTVQLPARGIRPPCNVRVHVRNGTVTLSGTIEFEMQRKAALHAATGVNGVQRVIDQLTVMRSTIGGWHTKTAGMQLKHLPTRPQTHPSNQTLAEAASSAEQTAATDSSEEPLMGSSPEAETHPPVPKKPR